MVSSILDSDMDFQIVLLAVVIAGFVIMYFLLKQQFRSKTDTELSTLVDQVFGKSAEKIAEQSKRLLESDKETIKADLSNKHQMIESLVTRLQKDLEKRQSELRTLEQDRSHKFSELSTSLSEHRKLTGELAQTTEQLSRVLSNNQARGEWGERIIEDLMRANGLMEGVHYAKQTKQISNTSRPDITLLLPNNRVVPVDVKFPYSDIQKLSATKDKNERTRLLKQFGSNIKLKIDKVAEYIQPDSNTLDYAIMFVPNEMVFSFINQQFPDVVDVAMKKRVLIVSPFTFLIVARTVLESYRNFMIGGKLKDVIKHIDSFVQEWQKFSEKLSKYGRSIGTLQTDYDDLMGTRYRQLEKKVESVRTITQGSLLDESDEKKLLE